MTSEEKRMDIILREERELGALHERDAILEELSIHLDKWQKIASTSDADAAVAALLEFRDIIEKRNNP